MPGDSKDGDGTSGTSDKLPEDVVLLAGPTEDGEGLRVLRAREERLETGEVRPMKDGKPLVGGEIVKLVPRGKSSRVCDVQVLAKVGAGAGADAPAGRGGPAQVATQKYRESWDRIFGGPEKPAAGMLN